MLFSPPGTEEHMTSALAQVGSQGAVHKGASYY